MDSSLANINMLKAVEKQERNKYGQKKKRNTHAKVLFCKMFVLESLCVHLFYNFVTKREEKIFVCE